MRGSAIIIIIIIIIIHIWDFFTPVLADCFQLGSEWRQISSDFPGQFWIFTPIWTIIIIIIIIIITIIIIIIIIIRSKGIMLYVWEC